MKHFNVVFVLLCLAAGLVAPGVAARTQIQNKGSDTLVNVAQAWAEAYQSVDPEVAVAVSGGGSGTGIAALINGTVDIANASRAMKSKEVAMAEKGGVAPMEHIVGYDALAVYLHANNPLNTLTIAQLKEIYGRGGGAEKWTDLGIEVPGCKGQQIVVVSRQNNSGTYAYFKKAVLGKKASTARAHWTCTVPRTWSTWSKNTLCYRLQRPGLCHRPCTTRLCRGGKRGQLRTAVSCQCG